MALTRAFYDAFDGTANTALESHTPDEGAGYTKTVWSTGDHLELDGSGNCRGNSSASGEVLYKLRKAADAAWASDQSIKITLATSSTATQVVYLLIRSTSVVTSVNLNGYRFSLALNTSAWTLRQYTGTTLTSTIASGTLSPVYATNDTFELRAVGTTISVLRNGVSFGSGTNSAYSAGDPYFIGMSSVTNPMYAEVEGFDEPSGGGGGVQIVSSFL